MLTDQPGREGVVRHHDLFSGVIHLVGAEDVRLHQCRPDPVSELGGRFAGERQSQHLSRLDGPRTNQPHDPSGHHGRLARASASNDDRRLQRRSDSRQLLVGELDSESGHEVISSAQPRSSAQVKGRVRVDMTTHPSTCLPSVWAGQLALNWHQVQDPPRVATKRSRATTLAAVASRW